MVIWLALAEMAYVTRTLFFKHDLGARRCVSDTSCHTGNRLDPKFDLKLSVFIP